MNNRGLRKIYRATELPPNRVSELGKPGRRPSFSCCLRRLGPFVFSVGRRLPGKRDPESTVKRNSLRFRPLLTFLPTFKG